MKTILGSACIFGGLILIHPGLALIALGGFFCLWGLPDDEPETVQPDEHKPTFSKQ